MSEVLQTLFDAIHHDWLQTLTLDQAEHRGKHKQHAPDCSVEQARKLLEESKS